MKTSCRRALALVLCLVFGPAWAGSSLTLIYSGNLDGELEPCGCSEEGNLGGLKRRATLLDELRQESPQLVVVSSGGLLNAEGPGDRLKSEYILKGFSKLGYDAVGMQWRDLAFGPEFALQAPLPWVVSNWQGGDAGPAKHKIIRRDAAQIAFFNWLAPEDSPLRRMQGGHALVTDDVAALREALRVARAEGAITVLATQLPAQRVAEVLGLDAVDILIERAAYEVFGEPRRLGRTLVLQPGSRGMRLGRLELELVQGRIRSWRHAVLSLPPSVADAPRMAAWYDEYNARVKAAYLQRVALRKQREEGQSPYVGEEACQACHAQAHEIWSTSDHAVAYDDLEGVNKAFDPECLQCHTVGLDQPGGFVDMAITGHLLGVQCESCHGAGREHVEARGKKALPHADWPRDKICAQCHTPAHSPGFDLDTYWPKIRH